MKDLFEQNLDVLKAMKKKQYRKAILENADRDLIACLLKCMKLACKRKLPQTYEQFKRLKYHRKFMEELVDSKEPFKVKKRKILQRGDGFVLQLLLPALAAIVGSLTK